MKKIFTLALAAAAVVGASASPLSFKSAPQIKLTQSKNQLTATSMKTMSVASRADETTPELTGGEYVAQFAMDFSDGFSSANPRTAKITKDGEGYVLDLGLNGLFTDLTVNDVKLEKVAYQGNDGTTTYFWGIPRGQVVMNDVELNDGSKVDVYIGGYAIYDMDQTTGAYAYKGNSSRMDPMFECSASGDFLRLIQFNWNGTTAPVSGIWFVADIQGKTYDIGLDVMDPVYYQNNASYSTTMAGEEGDEDISGECYVLPVTYQQLGSGYEAYGVADCGGAIISIVDGKDATCYPNVAIYYAGSAIYWGDAQNSADNFAAAGSFAENGDTKTITYDDLSWLLGNGQELGYFTNTTITFGGTGAINDVAVDNNNAPVEYFNLQGVRVNEPVAGQIVIRRQGNEVSKLLVK